MSGEATFSCVPALQPDLIETSVSNPPASATAGSGFSVTDTAKNQGNASAIASITSYYLSLDTTEGAGDILLTGSRSVPALGINGTNSGTITVTIPSSTASGSYYLLACADDTNVVDESNETNNCIASASKVSVSVAPPGYLSVTPSDGLSSSGSQGGPFSPSSKSYTLTNPGGSSINWTASKGQAWTTLSSTSGTLAANASTTVTVSINSNANAFAAGSYSDTVTFTNTTNGNGNTTRPVSLTVNLPSGEIILDNAPAGQSGGGRTFTGTWCASSATGYYGVDSLYSCGSGTDTYRWTPSIPAAGTYDVYVRWTAYSTRSTTVPIAVTYTGGTATKTCNQQTGGGTWVLHGTYSFNAGTGGYVEVSDINGQACADAVRFVPAGAPPTEIILDNAAAGQSGGGRSFTGTWCASAATGYYGVDSLYSCGSGTDTYRWTPSIPAAGTYDVYVRWTAYSTRSTTVPIAVTYTGGTAKKTCNQQTGGGTWVLHGTYSFNAGTGGYVEVSDINGQACADAVRFVPAGAPPTEIILDNAAAGQSGGGRSFTGTWCASAATGYYGVDSLYSCGSGTDTYRWTPTIPAAGTYDVYVRWTAYSTRSTTVPIAVTYTGGTATKTYNQQTGGGTWVLHGTYSFNAGTGGYVEVSDTNGQACADAVRFVPAGAPPSRDHTGQRSSRAEWRGPFVHRDMVCVSRGGLLRY